MIVGADDATDADVLRTSAKLYGHYDMRRVYYSAFSPIPDSSAILPLKAPPLLRENRLYQADWLLRYYGFNVDEIASGGEQGMLDLDVDPKLAWALKNRHVFPVDVNRAEREMLLRVPGLGARAVDKIVVARRHTSLRLEDVARLTSGLKRAKPFLVTADHHPKARLDRLNLRERLIERPEQLSLFA
jgi:predicted DNA-binding helix-hairpin-helix protein